MDAKKVSERIRVLTNKALDVYDKIFNDESGEMGLKEKKETADTVVLELSGLRAPTKIQSQSISTVLTPEELEAFKQRGMQTIEGNVIEEEKERGDDSLV